MRPGFRLQPAVLLILLPLAALGLSLCLGRYGVSLPEVGRALLSPLGLEADPGVSLVVLNVRLPRALLALVIGAGLAVSGCCLQAVFSNPLASPDTLGVSSGAAFGAALGILLCNNIVLIQSSALLFGLLAIAVTWLISRVRGKSNLLMIVLAGVICSAFFTALVSCIKAVADPQSKLPEITYWLMGSLSGASYPDLRLAALLIILPLVFLILMRWRLNILVLSEEEITSLGMNVRLVRWLVILLSTLIIAAAVSLCGQIGWVGLVIPHIARALCGTNHRDLIPASLSLGAAYLLIIDTLCRSLINAEIPLSILTALIGAPLFTWIFFRKGGAWF